MEPQTKTCTLCEQEKELNFFRKNRHFTLNRHFICLFCEASKRNAKKVKQTIAPPPEQPKISPYAAARYRGVLQQTVYVSLPIGCGKNPNPDQLKRAQYRAKEAANTLRQWGYKVITPFTLAIPPAYTYKQKLEMCLSTIRSQRPIMFFLDGWAQSYGCNEEWMLARDLYLSIELETSGGMRYMADRAYEYGFHPETAMA